VSSASSVGSGTIASVRGVDAFLGSEETSIVGVAFFSGESVFCGSDGGGFASKSSVGLLSEN
jgi:hypothetical protein